MNVGRKNKSSKNFSVKLMLSSSIIGADLEYWQSTTNHKRPTDIFCQFCNWCKNFAKNCCHYFKYQHKQTVRLESVALINFAILPEAISLTARDSHFYTGNFISQLKQHHISNKLKIISFKVFLDTEFQIYRLFSSML